MCLLIFFLLILTPQIIHLSHMSLVISSVLKLSLNVILSSFKGVDECWEWYLRMCRRILFFDLVVLQIGQSAFFFEISLVKFSLNIILSSFKGVEECWKWYLFICLILFFDIVVLQIGQSVVSFELRGK